MNDPVTKKDGRDPTVRNWLVLLALAALAAFLYGLIMVKVARNGF